MNMQLTKIGNTGNLQSKTPKSVEKDLPELLLGSSILKETSSKNKQFHIRSKSGGKIKDAKVMLENMSDSSYGCITLQIFGNDCSVSRDIDDILSSYDELITEAINYVCLRKFVSVAFVHVQEIKLKTQRLDL